MKEQRPERKEKGEQKKSSTAKRTSEREMRKEQKEERKEQERAKEQAKREKDAERKQKRKKEKNRATKGKKKGRKHETQTRHNKALQDEQGTRVEKIGILRIHRKTTNNKKKPPVSSDEGDCSCFRQGTHRTPCSKALGQRSISQSFRMTRTVFFFLSKKGREKMMERVQEEAPAAAVLEHGVVSSGRRGREGLRVADVPVSEELVKYYRSVVGPRASLSFSLSPCALLFLDPLML